jgi:hypothetical protein
VITRVPPEALALLDTELDSFEKLELASHLARAGGPVRRADLPAALRLDAEEIGRVLAELSAAELVEVDAAPAPAVRLGPRAAHDDFRTLLALYAEDRMAVVVALSSSAMRRIRTMAARTFGEAFGLQGKHKKTTNG